MTAAPEPIPGQLRFDDPVLDDLGFDHDEALVDEAEWRPTPGRPLTVEVVRSSRRRKTAQARMLGSTLEIRIPAGCSTSEEGELVAHFLAKFERKRSAEAVDLEARAAELARRHDLPAASSIRWVSNQRFRWGSCTPTNGSVRISDQLVGFPRWVIDYVIIHELAHLVVKGHGPEFWALLDSYPLTERARGFLMAKAGEH